MNAFWQMCTIEVIYLNFNFLGDNKRLFDSLCENVYFDAFYQLNESYFGLSVKFTILLKSDWCVCPMKMS